MKKTKKELEELKEEVEAVNEKLHELTDEELAQVTGGVGGVPNFQWAVIPVSAQFGTLNSDL